MTIQSSAHAAQVLMDCSHVIGVLFLMMALAISIVEESPLPVLAGGLSGFIIKIFLTNNPDSSATELIRFAEGTLIFTTGFSAFMVVLFGICIFKKSALLISLILGLISLNVVPSVILTHATGSFFSIEVPQEIITREIPLAVNTPNETESPNMMKVSFIESSAEALDKERTAKAEKDAAMAKERQLEEKKRVNAIKAAKKASEPTASKVSRSNPESTAIVIVPDAPKKRKIYNLYEEISAN